MLSGLWLGAGVLALAAWGAILVLPWQPHRTRERFEPGGPARRGKGAAPDGAAIRSNADAPDLATVTVLIPARNEAAVIGTTLDGLARQGRHLHVIVIDDESTDGTAECCARLDRPLDLDVVRGSPLPRGWGGKLWALQQGLSRVERAFVLLLDADIDLDAGVVGGLLEKAEREDCALVSVMAELKCETFWEKLLVPPFILFFKLLYPFACVNDPDSRAAAAAGGCILIRTAALRGVGGFERICGALIDDCSLAALVKAHGARIWLGLSHSVRSSRDYTTLASFWRMVSRTAFTQLHYSGALLAVVIVLMLALFLAPPAAVVFGPTALARSCGVAALLAMAAAYAPVATFYDRPLWWTGTLPAAALLFLAMTVSSALNYWRGVRARWKSRDYAV
jgi:hopene-associated glycosyltransferase HpnB